MTIPIGIKSASWFFSCTSSWFCFLRTFVFITKIPQNCKNSENWKCFETDIFFRKWIKFVNKLAIKTICLPLKCFAGLSMMAKFAHLQGIVLKYTAKTYFHFARVDVTDDRSIYRSANILAVKACWAIKNTFPVIISLNEPELSNTNHIFAILISQDFVLWCMRWTTKQRIINFCF